MGYGEVDPWETLSPSFRVFISFVFSTIVDPGMEMFDSHVFNFDFMLHWSRPIISSYK